jgi:uncharacterized protein (TIGR00369 family)
MQEIAKYPGCFVCGYRNAIGLKAKFWWDGTKAISSIVAQELYAGYKGLFHGGILAAVLDEIMIKALLAQGHYVVTAEMTIRYIRPVNTGDVLSLEGWLCSGSGSLFITAGRAVNQKGDVVAEATGKYIRPKAELSDKLLDSIE